MRRLTAERDDAARGRRPWGAIAFFAAMAVYLAFRFVQMGVWLVHVLWKAL